MKAAWRLLVLLLAFVFSCAASLAQHYVGERVYGDVGGGGAGTVIEVGHGVPYEGYVKVHFDNRNSYDPKSGDWIEINSGKVRSLNGAPPQAAQQPVAAQFAGVPGQMPGAMPGQIPGAMPGMPMGDPNTNGAGAYVGQRVFADVGGGGMGTIIQIGQGVPYKGYVKVHFDQRNGYDPKSGDWIELSSGKVKTMTGQTLSPPADFTAPAFGAPQQPDVTPQQLNMAPPAPQRQPGANPAQQNKKCSCPPSSEWSGNSLQAQIKSTIAGRYIRNGGALDEMHTPASVVFESFAITGSRPYAMPIPGAYETGSPDGPGGREGTKVYLVETKYTTCIDYPTETRLAHHTARYTCFVDTGGQMRCNQSYDDFTNEYLKK